MLTSTFIHVPGIGYATERKIWDLGASTWDRFLDLHSTLAIPNGKKALILPRIEESVERLAERDYAYFSRILPAKEHWRALSEFGDELAFLDIETTGCNWDDQITVIGLYDGRTMRSFVQGVDLDRFPEEVGRFKMLVTFFGSGFDLPVIRRSFPDLQLNHLHIDLCHLLHRLGYKGGLKHIEVEMGITRPEEANGLDGLDAVRLWNEYRHGNVKSLERLLLYNAEDVMNMKTLLSKGCEGMIQQLGLPLQSGVTMS